MVKDQLTEEILNRGTQIQEEISALCKQVIATTGFGSYDNVHTACMYLRLANIEISLEQLQIKVESILSALSVQNQE